MNTLPPQASLPSFPGEDEAYAALNLIGQPVWIFDIDHRRVHLSLIHI